MMRDELEAESRSILIAGHMPYLKRLLHLLRGTASGEDDFPLHGYVALERDDGGWKEIWRLR
jgi:phosphohistidine phosphatase SixA